MAPMQRNTALCFALSGLALLATMAHQPRRVFCFSGIVAAIGTLSLLEYLLGWNLGLTNCWALPT